MHFNKKSLYIASTHNLEHLKNWREHQDSLTDKLTIANGATDLEVVFQDWIKPTWWDAHVLQIHQGTLFQREIIMRSYGVEYWYARTVIPKKCYQIDHDFFNRLKNESIRNLIFNDDKVHRLNMINYPVDKQCLEYQWVKKHINLKHNTLWVRLAEYSFQYIESFYLMEILFPELERLS